MLGLGGIGSAAAYWLARRGARVIGARAVRARPRSRRIAGSLPHHPALLPRPPLRAAGTGGLRLLGRGRAPRRATCSCIRDRRPRPVPAPTAAIAAVDLHAGDGRLRRRVRAARRRGGDAALARVARSTRTSRRCSRSGAASPPPRARTRPTSASPRAHGADLRRARRVEAHRPPVARSRCASAGAPSGPPSWWSAPAPGRTTSLAHARPAACTSTVTREQVVYLEPRGAGGVRAGALPGLDLDGRAELLRLPGLRRGRRGEGRAGSRAARDDGGRHATFETDEDNLRARPQLRAAPLPARRRPRAARQDLPLHADARTATS